MCMFVFGCVYMCLCVCKKSIIHKEFNVLINVLQCVYEYKCTKSVFIYVRSEFI